VDYQQFEQIKNELCGKMTVVSELSRTTEKYGITIRASIVEWTNTNNETIWCLYMSDVEDTNKLVLMKNYWGNNKLGYASKQAAENRRNSEWHTYKYKWEHQKEQEELARKQKEEVDALNRKAKKAGLSDFQLEEDKVCVDKAQLIKLLDYKNKRSA
jgi:hypothetical protein